MQNFREQLLSANQQVFNSKGVSSLFEPLLRSRRRRTIKSIPTLCSILILLMSLLSPEQTHAHENVVMRNVPKIEKEILCDRSDGALNAGFNRTVQACSNCFGNRLAR